LLSNDEEANDRSVDSVCDGDQRLRQEIPFVDKMMLQAFGETLTNSSGSPMVGRIEKIWERTASLRGKLYRLPGGSVGREFTSILAEEYEFFGYVESRNLKGLQCLEIDSSER
jgi:hypothetical protein